MGEELGLRQEAGHKRLVEERNTRHQKKKDKMLLVRWGSSTKSATPKSNSKIVSKTKGQTQTKFLKSLEPNYHATSTTNWQRMRGGPGFYAATGWCWWGPGELIIETEQACNDQDLRWSRTSQGKPNEWAEWGGTKHKNKHGANLFQKDCFPSKLAYFTDYLVKCNIRRVPISRITSYD